jgi:hypothetical protein
VNARDDRIVGPDSPVDPNLCQFHSSDTWVVVDALIAIVTALATIFVVAIRHPFRIISIAILIATIGTIAGWWTP